MGQALECLLFSWEIRLELQAQDLEVIGGESQWLECMCVSSVSLPLKLF